ncbi:MAG: polysaccharide pyruvyl transferase family protein [Promicromonosporaceae bacterium]|nr:polysaccharide pyruvyl transferase family protein [Promicromonosporaceae bacterium]
MRRGGATRVGLLGQFGIHNFGNEASLAAVLEVLRGQPGVEPVVVSDHADVVAAEHGVAAVPLRSPSAPRGGLRGLLGKAYDAAHAWRTVRGLDVLVVPGTGILEGLAASPGGIPLTLAEHAAAARLLRRPLWLLSVGVDEAAGPLTARLHRFVLDSARYATVRDDGSARAAAALGVRRVPGVVPDLVLGAEPAPRAPAPHERPVVAVGVIDYQGIGTAESDADRAAYLDRTTALVRLLVDAGNDVRVVGGALPDAATVAEVARRAGAGRPGRVAEAPASSLDDVDRALAGCAAVVAVRYHNLVASLRAGVPSVAVAYGRKQEWLLDQLGQGGRVHRVDAFDPAEVAADVARAAAADGPANEALTAARTAIAAQYDALLAALAPRAASPAPARPAPEEAVAS